MLVNFDATGRVRWYNLYISKEAAQCCLAADTIWMEGGLPDYPQVPEGSTAYLRLAKGRLVYALEEEAPPVYTDTELLMQRLTDLELLLYSIRMGGGGSV